MESVLLLCCCLLVTTIQWRRQTYPVMNTDKITNTRGINYDHPSIRYGPMVPDTECFDHDQCVRLEVGRGRANSTHRHGRITGLEGKSLCTSLI